MISKKNQLLNIWLQQACPRLAVLPYQKETKKVLRQIHVSQPSLLKTVAPRRELTKRPADQVSTYGTTKASFPI